VSSGKKFRARSASDPRIFPFCWNASPKLRSHGRALTHRKSISDPKKFPDCYYYSVYLEMPHCRCARQREKERERERERESVCA